MKQKIEKMKIWANEHKLEILVGIGIVISGGVVYKIIASSPKATEVTDILKPIKYVKTEVPEGLVGLVDEISAPEGVDLYKDVWLKDARLSDLGKIGEELMKLDGFSGESYISGVVSMSN